MFCTCSGEIHIKHYLEGSSKLEDFLEDFHSISRTSAISVLEAARERLALDSTTA
jgi:hypothetical protein